VLPEYYLVVCSENDGFLLLAMNVDHTLALQMSQQVTTCRCKPGQLTKRPLCGRNSVEGNWVGAWEAHGCCRVRPTGGSVRVFSFAKIGGGSERRTARRLSTWTRYYQCEVAIADLGYAVVGVFMAAQLRFGHDVTRCYLTLSLALPVLWIAAPWLARGVKAFDAGTVAVLACSEMDGIRLRSLAWELEEAGTDLCGVPSLLGVAGPRTMVRPTAGLTLLQDPRVTAVSAHLRRWSFGELPQLFNVFPGYMSLVEPGPALSDNAGEYAEHVRCRPVVKPCLTGPVAGQQAIGAVLGGVSSARPAVRLELSFALRAADLRRASHDANPKSDNCALSATPLTES
jgi:hypothetical protein